jgi:3-oxoacyl-[acyl-carrier-protein] synthase II
MPGPARALDFYLTAPGSVAAVGGVRGAADGSPCMNEWRPQVSTMRGIWITGVGVVSAAGTGAPALRTLLREQRSAVATLPLSYWSVGRCPTPPRVRAARLLDRSARLFAAAAEEAWRGAGFTDAPPDPSRCDVIEGSSLGALGEVLPQERDRSVAGSSRASGLRLLLGAGGADFAEGHGVEGAVFHISAGSVSSAMALIEAVARLEAGRADVVVAGGGECPLDETVLASFAAGGILTPSRALGGVCRPFDLDRGGTVLGEGAGALILERAEHASRRGAAPLAVILGTGWSRESYRMTGPDPTGRGVTQAARQAIGGLGAAKIGWIKTHGAGTRLNDAAECEGLAALMGDDLPDAPLTSLKPALGHSLGASAAVETVAAVLALQDGMVPPTLNTLNPDPSLPPCTVALEPLVPREPVALLLAESFDGRCAAWTLAAAA